jgi:DNA primase
LPGDNSRFWVDDVAGLLGLVAMDAVELHPWAATVENIERPDRLVFDLDPGPGIDWAFVVDTALKLEELLEAEGLRSWPKLTGGKGLHVMVPVVPRLNHPGRGSGDLEGGRDRDRAGRPLDAASAASDLEAQARHLEDTEGR